MSCEEFNAALSESLALSSIDYHLNSYNCTDYAIEVANIVGCGVADTESEVVYNGKNYGTFSNPGQLGEDIRETTSGVINPSGGIAPQTNCN